MWCTPTSGMSFAKLMAFASATPTSSAPTRPGPYVTPMASKSSRVTSASFNASSMTWLIFSMCFLEAISGTTPPYNLCSSIWDDMILDNMVLPFFTTEAAVSSQELSIARISTSSFFFSILLFHKTHRQCPGCLMILPQTAVPRTACPGLQSYWEILSRLRGEPPPGVQGMGCSV